MEQTNKYYPKFEAGQVLTSKALNDYFGYLDEQQRLTRTQLLGVGIINGLEFKHEGNAITITKGTAVTADGYLIDLPKDTIYTLAYEYDKNSDTITKSNPLTGKIAPYFDGVLDAVKYVLYKDENDASLHNQNIQSCVCIPSNLYNYIIALVVDFVSQDTITQCSELSCDIVQSNYQIEIRPVLIPMFNRIITRQAYICGNENDDVNYSYADIIDNFFTPDITQPFFHSQPFFHYFNPIYGLSGKVLSGSNYETFIQTFYNFVVENCIENIKAISFKNIPSYVIYDDAIKFFRLFPDNLSKTLERFTALENHIGELKKVVSPISGLHIHHVLNIAEALNEYFDLFVEFFKKKYPILPSDEYRFHRIILLGSGGMRPQHPNAYREYNNSILHDKQFLADCTRLYRALNRVFFLSESFNNDYTPDTSPFSFESRCFIRKPLSKMAERVAPNFYRKATYYGDLGYNWWKICEHDYHNMYDIGDGCNNNCQLIMENYYGMKLSELINQINTFTKKYLPNITIETIPMGNIDYTISKVEDMYKRLDMESLSENYGISKQVIDAIDKKAEIDPTLAKKTIIELNSILGAIQPDDNTPMRVVLGLEYCKEYVSYYAGYTPIQIGGCPFDGKLLVYYTNDNEETVLLVVGTDKNG